jgi:acyl-homoserine-lactone acylase
MNRSIAISILLLIGISVQAAIPASYPTIEPSHIQIVRDSFGIPHIFAPTDAEVAYGLAWANSEDAFAETQKLIYAAKGYMGRVEGIEGAKTDYFVHAIGARKIVNERYPDDLSPAFRKYLDGYVQGVNAYAAAHPREVVRRSAFPITAQDMLTAYTIVMSALCFVQNDVANIVGGKLDSIPVNLKQLHPTVGSNAYAINRAKSADGKTYLCINPHLMMDGALSFYEAHLQSEEGLAIMGPMFQSGTSMAMGTTPHLGWGFTWNYFDRVDDYRLEMHPHKRLYYKYDGQWEKLQRRTVWLKVDWHGIVLPIAKHTYWSKYGSTLKSDKGRHYYAIRYPANMTIKSGQQLYEMARADNYNAFRQALRDNHALVMFNMVYADDKDNILFLSHGMMPDRSHPEYNWEGILPGNTSETLWNTLIPIDSMPHVLNPPCGWVYNTNNSPYDATCAGHNDNPARLPRSIDLRPGNNNRAMTLRNFLANNDHIAFEVFKGIKYETHFAKESAFMTSLKPLWSLDPKKYPDVQELTALIQHWDRTIDTASESLTGFGMFLDRLFTARHWDDEQLTMGFAMSEAEMVTALRDAQQFMLTNWGSIHIPWGRVHRLRRGSKTYPYSAFADMLSPSYPKPHTYNGKVELNPEFGDTYTMYVKYGEAGAERIESIQPLGNSLDSTSSHYTDQMELFLAQKTRVQTFDKSYWMTHAEAVYHPMIK